jgi:hypothetical protein
MSSVSLRGEGGVEVGTNYRGPEDWNGVRSPTMLCVFLSFSGVLLLSIVQINTFRPNPSHNATHSLSSFFFWDYSLWLALASSTFALHCSRSCYLGPQYLTPIFFRASSTDSSHLTRGFPTHRVPSGLRTVSSQQGTSSCILTGCHCHHTFPFLSL